MSCEIHDDQWYCFLQEGQWVHIKKEEWNKSEPKEVDFPEKEESRLLSDEYSQMSELKPYGGVKLKRFTRDEAPEISEEQAREIFPEIKPNAPEGYDGKEFPKSYMDDEFKPFGKIFDILNGKE